MFVYPHLYRVTEPWPPSYPTLVRHSGPARKMSIVMVGPFPGPFDRSHYSDSCSGNPTDLQPRPSNAQGLGQRPPRPPDPHLALLKEQELPRTSRTPRDVVAYSTVRTNYGAPSKAYAPMPSRESRHEFLPEPPRPRRASLKRKCHALLCRLAVVALCLIAVAVLVVAVSRSMRVRADTAPVKGGSAAVRPANGTDHRGTIGIRDTSSTEAAALAAVGRTRARSTVRPPAETRHYKRRHGETGNGEKVTSQMSSSSSSASSLSSSSSEPSSFAIVPWLTTETADHEPSALRRQSDVTTAPPSGVLMERAAVRTSFEADGTAALLTASSKVASVASTSPATVFSGPNAASNGETGDSGPPGELVESTSLAASEASTRPGKTTEAGSVAAAPMTASTDLPEVINEADGHGDLQQV
ncbi:hypothetical protein HPB51_020077 [Rhipicephalus microplus]|uniref:Uncharacterized protein n=1 Tax=Rhipicephalus microplus TaxID=6941 RepID=A0A9J6EBM3_RHIMP|nr:hypothetical protein HPB51_020077 [Rhipicephalus microplus]